MTRPQLEIADIFRLHGQQWRDTHQGHVDLSQLKVMSAIENCRTQVLGGHILRCQACEHIHISYNSCRNRHCPKCQASSAKRWLEARQAQLLPVDYYQLVFTLPKEVANLAYYNKSVMYGLLLKVAAETLLTIGGDVKRLGYRANQDSFFLFACYQDCLDVCTLKSYIKHTSNIHCCFLAMMNLLKMRNCLLNGLRHYAKKNGLSMLNVPFLGQKLYLPTCRDIRIELRYRIAD